MGKVLTRSQQKNKDAGEQIIKFIGFVVILAVAGFAEVAFLGIVSKMFPGNPIFRAMSIMGAVATGISCVTMVAAKLKWVRAGTQHYVSWIFLFVELIIMGMNLIISFQLAQNGNPASLDPWMQSYYQIIPATPLAALIGWIVMFMTDRTKEIADARRDMEEELEEMELAHEGNRHKTKIELQTRVLEIHKEQISVEIEKYVPFIKDATHRLVGSEISAMMGMYIPTNQPAAIETTATRIPLGQMSLAQTATPPTTPAISHKETAQPRETVFDKIKAFVSKLSGEHDVNDLDNCTCDVCRERRAREQIAKNNAAFDWSTATEEEARNEALKARAEAVKLLTPEERAKVGPAPKPFLNDDPYGANAQQDATNVIRAKSNQFAANKRRNKRNRRGKRARS